MPRRVSPSRTVWFHGVGLGSGIGLGMAVPVFPATAGVRTGVPVGKVVLVGESTYLAMFISQLLERSFLFPAPVFLFKLYN